MIRFTRVTWNDVDYVLLPGYISVDDLADVNDLMACIYETPADEKIRVIIESMICKLERELPEDRENIRDATIEELGIFLDDDEDDDDNDDDYYDEDGEDAEDEDDYDESDEDEPYSSIIDDYIKSNSIVVIDTEEITFDGENRDMEIVELNL